MDNESISKKTRNEFREYFVGTSLREIEAEFDSADVPFDKDHVPQVSGQRRSLVEQYYHAVDWSKWSEAKRVLVVFENVLIDLENKIKDTQLYSEETIATFKSNFSSLKSWIERDGFKYEDGRLHPTKNDVDPTDVEEHARFDMPEFWDENYLRLFISHVSRIKEFAGALQFSLRQYGISAFVAHEDIMPTREWQREIEVALHSMHALTALLSNDFHASNWTDQEVGFAMGKKVKIIPVKMDVDPYGFIGSIQAVPGYGRDPESLARSIFTVLKDDPRTGLEISRGLAEVLAASSTFAFARRTVDLIIECTHFDESVLKRIAKANEENNQVYESWGVPEKIEDLLKNTAINNNVR